MIEIFFKVVPLDEKIGHTKYFLSTRFLTSSKSRGEFQQCLYSVRTKMLDSDSYGMGLNLYL